VDHDADEFNSKMRAKNIINIITVGYTFLGGCVRWRVHQNEADVD
jgi:hypothetical protein